VLPAVIAEEDMHTHKLRTVGSIVDFRWPMIRLDHANDPQGWNSLLLFKEALLEDVDCRRDQPSLLPVFPLTGTSLKSNARLWFEVVKTIRLPVMDCMIEARIVTAGTTVM